MKKFLGVLLSFAFVLCCGIGLVACGDKPWIRVSVPETYPAHVQSISVLAAQDDVPGATKGSSCEIGVMLDFGWTINDSDFKLYANGSEITNLKHYNASDTNAEEYWIYTIKKVNSETTISYSGSLKQKTAPFSLKIELDETEDVDYSLYNGNTNYSFNFNGKSNLSLDRLIEETNALTEAKMGDYIIFEVVNKNPEKPGFVASDYCYYGEEGYVSSSVGPSRFEYNAGGYKSTYKLLVDGVKNYRFSVYSEGFGGTELSENSDIIFFHFGDDTYGLIDDTISGKLYLNDERITKYKDMKDGMQIKIDMAENNIVKELANDIISGNANGAYLAINSNKIDMADVSINGDEIIVSNVKPVWKYVDNNDSNRLVYEITIENLSEYITSSENWVESALLENLHDITTTIQLSGIVDGEGFAISINSVEEEKFAVYNYSVFDEQLGSSSTHYYYHKGAKLDVFIQGNFLMDEAERQIKITVFGKEFIIKITENNDVSNTYNNPNGEWVNAQDYSDVEVKFNQNGAYPNCIMIDIILMPDDLQTPLTIERI